MKKIIFLILIACIVIGFAASSFASVDSVYEASVVEINGSVKVDTKGDGIWITPWIGMKLMENALLKTGAGSSATIVFDPEGLNELNIKANSQIVVKESSVELPGGSVLAKFANMEAGSSFVVKTPTAACGIRGSGMGVDFINGMTVTMAYEHSVYVQGLDAAGNPVGVEVAIPQGWTSQIAAGGAVTPPSELTANEQAIWDAWIAVVLPPGTGDVGDTDETDTKDLDEDAEVSPSQ